MENQETLSEEVNKIEDLTKPYFILMNVLLAQAELSKNNNDDVLEYLKYKSLLDSLYQQMINQICNFNHIFKIKE